MTMSKKTIKVTIRKNCRSPQKDNKKLRYPNLFGFYLLKTGWRFNFPYGSISCFNGGRNNPTMRSRMSGIRVIWENNRRRSTRITHNVA